MRALSISITLLAAGAALADPVVPVPADVCYAATGGAPAAAPPIAAPPPRFVAKACAGLPDLDEKLKPLPLLGDRLRIPFPKSAKVHEPLAHDVMGAPPSEESMSRLSFHIGDRGFIVLAKDLTATAPGDKSLACHFTDGTALAVGATEEAIKQYGAAVYGSDPIALPRPPSGLRVTAFVPKGQAAVDREGNHFALGAVVELPDSSLVKIDIAIGSKLTTPPCVAAALELVSRITLGARKVDLKAGPRRFGSFTVEVPERTVIRTTRGPDYDEYRIERYAPLSLYSGLIIITVERPEEGPKPTGGELVKGTLFGAPVSFRGAAEGRERVASASVAIPKEEHRNMRVELVATRDPAYLHVLAKIVASIRAAK